jgi:hypothetical protein
MKVIYKMKNMMNQEVQHSLESKLIEVMNFQNASDSIRVKCDFDSNLIDESDLQGEKQPEPRISIWPAISICDESETF